MQPALGLAVCLALLGGCAATLGEGEIALRQRRYADAARYFRDALATRDGVDARLGLGVALYHLEDFGAAVEALTPVIDRAPRHAEARLYLALSHLRRGDDASSREQLTTLVALDVHPRLAAQSERVREVVATEALSPALRRFVAMSLEDEMLWARDLREATLSPRAPLEPTWYIYYDGWYPHRGYPYGSP
jgi:tetratricopeptide (TPR) repeat protein